MAPDDQSGGARPVGPVVLRIKLRYDDVETMVQRFASNVGKSGLFLPTKSVQPIGTEVKFELRLANDTPVLVGLGRVKYIKPPDPRVPKAAFGMAIELTRVSREGREIIIRMIERRRAMGLADVAIPIPDDNDTARRGDIETQPRIDTSGIVREAMRDFATAPVQEQVLGGTPPADTRDAARASALAPAAPPPPLTDVDPAAAEIAAAKAAAVAEQIAAAKAAEAAAAAAAAAAATRRSATTPPPIRESGPSFTAPRAGSGPIPVVTAEAASAARSVPVLAPEPPRARRPRAADLMAKATELSERLASVQLSDLEQQQVDVERALARARALAGGDLEGELASLRESVSAPIEISIEAASAELARQLGGKPITKRERSTRWSAPLAPVEVRADASVPVVAPSVRESDGFQTKTRAATEAVPASATDHVETRPVAAPVVAPPAPAVEAPVVEAAPPAPTDEAIEAAPVLAEVPALAEAASTVDTAPGVEPVTAVAPALGRDDRTPIPTGDDYVDAMLPPVSTSDEPADDLAIPVERDLAAPALADAAMLQRALEGSTPALALDESDLEAIEEDEDHGERTTIGSFPVDPRAFAGHGGPTQPDVRSRRADSFADELEAQLDRQLAEAEAEADEDMRELADGHRAASEPVYASEPAYTIEPYVRRDSIADPAGFESEPVPLVRASSLSEEVSDLDVLAEADEGDADLMQADGEHDRYEPEIPAPPLASPDEQAYEPGAYEDDPRDAAAAEALAALEGLDGPSERPSQDDFASRLDLDDEPDPEESRHFPTANPRPGHPSYEPPSEEGAELIDQPSSTYTFAEPFVAPGETVEFDEPHDFSKNTPVPASRSRRSSHAPQPAPAPPPRIEPPTEDLESALAALDVDLDPRGEPRRPRRTSSTPGRPLPGLPVHRPGDTGAQPVAPRSRTGSAATAKPPTMPPPVPMAARTKQPTAPAPVPTRVPQRPSTDDGIMIDFDDEE